VHLTLPHPHLPVNWLCDAFRGGSAAYQRS